MNVFRYAGACVCMAACGPLSPKPDSGALRFSSEDPLLTGLAVTCDQTAGRWTVDLRADAWIGTARLWMATQPTGIEQHDLSVKRSAPDASWDCFDTTISLASDFGDPGSGTRNRCADHTDVHILLAISDASSQRWTDCVTWGPQGAQPWADESSIPACDNVLTDVFAEDTYTYETGDVASCE